MNDATALAGAAPAALPAERLYRRCDPARLSFATTAELAPLDGLVGQARAFEAIGVASKIDKKGFNLFVIGPNALGMQEAVRSALAADAGARPSPFDWVYVNNFAHPDRPVAIELPPGRAPSFKEAMRKLIDDLKIAAPAAFQSEDYQTRRAAIDEAFQKKQFEAFSALREKASAKSIVLLRTPVGFALAPSQNGQVTPPDEFNAWPEAKRRQVQEDIAALENELERTVRQVPQWDKQRRDDLRALNRETAKFAVDHLIEEVAAAFADIPRVAEHIAAVRADLIENVPMFVAKSDGEADSGEPTPGAAFER